MEEAACCQPLSQTPFVIRVIWPSNAANAKALWLRNPKTLQAADKILDTKEFKDVLYILKVLDLRRLNAFFGMILFPIQNSIM